MKKLLLVISLSIATISSAKAWDINPMFGEGREHQITLNFGQGTDATWLFSFFGKEVPFHMGMLGYSRPNMAWGLPGRNSVQYVQTVGWDKAYGWDWGQLTRAMFVITEDVALFWGNKWYLGIGMGASMQELENYRIDTKLIFSLKMFLGFKIAEGWHIELFNQHYSNGETSHINYSYNFYGAGFTYSF